MAHVAEWTITEAAGRQHRVLVDRSLLGGVRVVLDRRRLDRFDQTPESDRYVTSLAGHVLTVVLPRVSNDLPTLHVDGKPVLGSETTLIAAATDATGATVSGQDLLRHQLLQRRGSGGAWFYWVGGASILNTVLDAAGVQWGLAVGLGVTYLIDGMADYISDTVRTPIYAVIIDVAIAAGFLLIGRAARRGKLGWYAVGTVLYFLDGLLFLLAADILGIAVHAIAIYGLISGWRAARSLKKVEAPAPALVASLRRISRAYSGKYLSIVERSNSRRIDVFASRARRNSNERLTKSATSPPPYRSRSARETRTTWFVVTRS